MTDKIELGSDAWLAELKSRIELALTQPDRSDTVFSLCEVFTGVPPHLDKHGTGILSWHARIADGQVTFADGEASDVVMKTTCDYDFIVPFARAKLTPANAAEITALMEDGAAAGKLSREGDRSQIPIWFHAIHNDLAEITA